jgi:hypothetical protein
VLLLVLILILIAFGLLVVALLSGSVLWAWVSVAVSAVAALVLIVDALQRRSAARAAAAADGGAVPPQDRSIPEADRPEPEPVTEILPVVRSTPPGSSVEPDAGGSSDPAGRFAPNGGADRTVAVSQRQPPGSDERPPGAVGGTPSVTGNSSPSVTKSGSEASTTKVGAVGSNPGFNPGSNEATVAVQSRGDIPPVDLGKGAAPADPRFQRDQPHRDQPPDRNATDAAAQSGVKPSDPTVHGVAPADVPAAGGEPVEAAAGADAEPPEEPHDATAAAIVAMLPDEVVVVDEQPRYHLGTCRALISRALIPLPVREAVELGFTPCGWCSPDRTLAERHPARAQ